MSGQYTAAPTAQLRRNDELSASETGSQAAQPQLGEGAQRTPPPRLVSRVEMPHDPTTLEEVTRIVKEQAERIRTLEEDLHRNKEDHKEGRSRRAKHRHRGRRSRSRSKDRFRASDSCSSEASTDEEDRRGRRKKREVERDYSPEYRRDVSNNKWRSVERQSDHDGNRKSLQFNRGGHRSAAISEFRDPMYEDGDDGTPFSEDIMATPLPHGFKEPTDMEGYDGTADPQDHLDAFRSRMYLSGATDAIKCRAFPITLRKSALKWFNTLPPRSITRFADVSSRFLAHFTTSKAKRKSVTTLLSIKQGPGEPLREYFERFNQEALKIKDLHPQAVLLGLVNGLRTGPFTRSLAKSEPETLEELQRRAEKYINMEETIKLKADEERQQKRKPSPKREDISRKESRMPKVGRFHEYTPLTASLGEVYREVHQTERLPKPKPLRPRTNTNRSLYCEYHESHGHKTEDCYDLRDAIEQLVREGKLARYVAARRSPRRRNNSPSRGDDRRNPRSRRSPENPTCGDEDARDVITRTINTIAGGFAGGGSTKSARKRHLKEVLSTDSSSTKVVKREERTPDIVFTTEDMRGIVKGHDDPMVISAAMINAEVKRVLVDQGSSADILFREAFDKLGLKNSDLRSYGEELVGFTGEKIRPDGYVPLHVTLGSRPSSKTIRVEFLVVNCSSAYNAILGRPSLNQLGAVVSTAHLMMKFPGEDGEVISVKGDQSAARRCYNASLEIGKMGEETPRSSGGCYLSTLISGVPTRKSNRNQKDSWRLYRSERRPAR